MLLKSKFVDTMELSFFCHWHTWCHDRWGIIKMFHQPTTSKHNADISTEAMPRKRTYTHFWKKVYFNSFQVVFLMTMSLLLFSHASLTIGFWHFLAIFKRTLHEFYKMKEQFIQYYMYSDICGSLDYQWWVNISSRFAINSEARNKAKTLKTCLLITTLHYSTVIVHMDLIVHHTLVCYPLRIF